MQPTSLESTSAAQSHAAGRSSAQRRLRQGYAVMSGIVALAILAQVFLAGGGIFAEPSMLSTHRMFGMMLSLGPAVLLALGFAGRLPVPTLVLTALLLLLVGLQPVLINVPEQVGVPLLKALHVVNALLIFALTVVLGHQVWRRAASTASRS